MLRTEPDVLLCDGVAFGPGHRVRGTVSRAPYTLLLGHTLVAHFSKKRFPFLGYTIPSHVNTGSFLLSHNSLCLTMSV